MFHNFANVFFGFEVIARALGGVGTNTSDLDVSDQGATFCRERLGLGHAGKERNYISTPPRPSIVRRTPAPIP